MDLVLTADTAMAHLCGSNRRFSCIVLLNAPAIGVGVGEVIAVL